MKILLAVSMSNERFNTIPDIGLGYLASYARQAGNDVHYLDCVLEKYSLQDFQSALCDFSPDLLGIKVFSCDIEPARRMLKVAREILPGVKLAIGGPHPSSASAEDVFQQFPNLDFAMAGEADSGFVTFLSHLQTGISDFSDVAGLIWRDGDGVLRVNPRAFVMELDSIPFPAWDLLQPNRYKSGYSFMTPLLPAAPMTITRGCPFHCTYCQSHLLTGRKVRRRSIDNVIEEITLLQREYGVRTIDIVDENFTFDNAYATTFCQRLIAEDIDIKWNCPYGVRLNSLNEDLVCLMEKSGCVALSLGIESGSDRILESVRKSQKVEMVAEKVRMIKRVSKIALQGYFMYGFPTETVEEVRQSIRLACSLPLDMVVFHPLRLTPGTELFNQYVVEGKVPEGFDYQGYGHHYFVRSYCEIPDAEMKRLYKEAYLRFYARPKVIFNLLRMVRTWAQVKTLANGALRLTPLNRKICL
jgi:anaerobic magnesium-protoporphyrin IX monomethyl ester cyclase